MCLCLLSDCHMVRAVCVRVLACAGPMVSLGLIVAVSECVWQDPGLFGSISICVAVMWPHMYLYGGLSQAVWCCLWLGCV